ncbi:hypothetical protein ACFX13_015682 [Malus domestica]|uniref:Uncharacterized protein n=1 Tax=Malus domestica TaxID=3750 RepID=A0A498I1B4_MALDO|nr:hypothetical protein DVH24_039599 [Malus domestica]
MVPISTAQLLAAVSSNPKLDFVLGQLSEAPKAGNLSNPTIKFEAPENVATDCEAGPSEEKKDGKQSDSAGFAVKSGGESDSPPALKLDLIEKGLDVADVDASSLPVKVEKLDEMEHPKSERCNKDEELIDVTNDSGSMTRHVAAKLGSEANLEMEGVEGDELSKS